MDSALSGVVVLDVATDMAGSHACMLLADMGAEVLKVELAGQQDWRGSLPFHLWNRGKKSICLDLDKEGGREALEAMVGRADVLVEDFRPSEAKALGIDYDSLTHLNDRLLYCAMPPFGEEGPLRDKPADDGVVSAFSAIMGDQTGPKVPPEFITVPGPSCGAAFLAAYAICSALYVREVEGISQKIEVPLLNGSLAMQSGLFIEGPGVTPEEGPIKDPRGSKPAYRLYECSDGKWIFIACGNNTFWNRLCITLGLEELACEPRYENAPWFYKEEDRLFMISVIGDKIKQHPQAYWLQLFDQQDIPIAPADSRDEFVEDPQVVQRSMMFEVEDPRFGLTRQMGFAVSIDGAPGAVNGPAPERGQHGEEILKGLGYTESQRGQLKKSGALIR